HCDFGAKSQLRRFAKCVARRLRHHVSRGEPAAMPLCPVRDAHRTPVPDPTVSPVSRTTSSPPYLPWRHRRSSSPPASATSPDGEIPRLPVLGYLRVPIQVARVHC